jgi:hypothetical protein
MKIIHNGKGRGRPGAGVWPAGRGWPRAARMAGEYGRSRGGGTAAPASLEGTS